MSPAAKFCGACGASLAAPQSESAEARKVVTIVFADLIGSTALHERLDAESARRLMDRYHRSMGAVVEAHGGTVMQLLGDGVLAGFGVPRVAEDDAIRAVRAAVGMQQAFRALAAEQAGLAGDIGLRVAVNTGEVVAGDDHTHVMGDPVNVAARLQQEARDGDVLLGESTQRLVSERVTLAAFGSFALKGRAEPVAAYRVVSLERPAGAAAIAFVGREEELRRIRAVYDTAGATRAARLAVILGSPGLGKSRLIDEFTRRLDDGATVLLAHCDAAGGATFAPLAEALRELLRIDDGASGDTLRAAILSGLPESESERARIADGVAALVAGTPASPEEIFFVVRRGLAALATTRPVVLAIDDVQWAEPLLLDLIEHLVQWGSDVPLLVLAAARPELRDTRSSLATSGGLVSDVVTLAGLDAGAATRLAANVIGAEALPAAIAGRVLATSEGNPLFVGELVRMLVHDGALKLEGERWTAGVEVADLEMPPTIHALLAARIERLRPEERTVLERAAVIGRHFSRTALAQLLPRELGDLDARLESLRRSELVEPDTGWFLGEPVLRFHHVLIRDAAYRRLLKNTRAELHGRFADWLEARAAGAVEHDETLGWHLEQAHQHLRELGPIDAQGRAFGERAARHLAAAGRRALARDDLPPAASLLERALGRLDPDDPARADLTLDWCEALLAAGDVGTAGRAIAELGRFIADSDRLRAWHTCFGGQLAVFTDPKALRASAQAVEAAAAALTSAGDAAGEAKAHSVHALVLAQLGKIGACEAALDKALAAARRAHDRRRANAVLAGAPVAALWGPSPVTRASGRCLDVVRVLRITQGAPAVEAVALRCQAVLETLRGRAEAARRMIASSRRMVEELGITQRVLEADLFAGLIELLEGDAAAAERFLRVAYDGLRAQGLGIDAAQAAALLGRALLAQGRIAEAEAISVESESLAGDSFKAAIAWRGVRAEALAARGEHASAVELARAAVEIAAATDDLLDHADARQALSIALRAAGMSSEADVEEKRAIELWEAKGATLLAERARRGARRSIESPRSPGPSVAPAQTPLRRVRPNAATENSARMVAVIAAKDADALPALFADSLAVEDHQTGVAYGRRETLASLLSTIRVQDLRFREMPLATLGDSLALLRESSSGVGGGTLDAGAFELERILLCEVDAEGRCRRTEVFAPDRLGDGVARLYERYAELLPDGPERTRAAATARSVAALPGSPSHWPFAPDVEATDHRTVGWGSVHGSDAAVRVIRTLPQLSDDLANCIDDVLDLRSDVLLVRWTNSGTDRASGGAFERKLDVLWVFGADGLVTRWEQFDAEQDAEALARFDALTAAAPPVRLAAAPSRAVERRERRVRPNAATAHAAREDAAFAARDADAFATLFADELEVVDHPNGATHDQLEYLTTLRRLLRAQDLTRRQEPLATLGDALALCRMSLSASGIARGKFDVGAYEYAGVALFEVDAQGRCRRAEHFALDHLGNAVARLFERYADLLPDGPERSRAAATARSVAAMLGPFDPDRYAAAFAPAIEVVDHRTLGFMSARGAEAHVQNLRSWLLLSDDAAMRQDEILCLQSDAYLARRIFFGTDRAGGGAFERPFIQLWVSGGDGLLTRVEYFDADREAEALARLDELTADRQTVRRRVRANAATRSYERFAAILAARDDEALAQIFDESLRVVHHPTGFQYGRREMLATWRPALKARRLDFRQEFLASLGDALALDRHLTSLEGLPVAELDEFGVMEVDEITLLEADDRERFVRSEIFAVDHLGDAISRLYERHAELLPEGPARVRAAATARSVAAMLGPFDVDRFATAIAPTLEAVDHRILGTWSARGAEEMLQHFRSQLEVASDISNRHEILCLQPDAMLVRRTQLGTDRASGGAYERSLLMLLVFGTEGLLTRGEWFDADRDTEALDRFDALAAGAEPKHPDTRRVRPNAATANLARADAAIAARDADALPSLLADRVEVVDHTTGATYDRSGLLATQRSLLSARDPRYRSEPLATLGDSLALSRGSTSASGFQGARFDVGAYEREEIVLLEADSQGRRLRTEILARDRLGDAIGRLYERYAELCPDGRERTRAAATARSVAVVLGPFDPDRYATVWAPAIAYDDHRVQGIGPLSGAATALQWLRSLLEVAENIGKRFEDVLGLRSDALLLRWTNFGTERAGGGSYERHFLWLGVFGTDGFLTRLELFEGDRDAEALARFDELAAAAAPARSTRRRVLANAATANLARLDAVIAARDADALARLFDDEMQVVNHHLAGGDYDREGALATWRSLLSAKTPVCRHEPLATLGDRLVLCRQLLSASGFAGRRFDVGAYEREVVGLEEVDSNGRQRRAEFFASDNLGDAVVRLYECSTELLPEGPARTRAAATMRSVAALLGPPDRWPFAPDVEAADHRTVGFGSVHGAEAVVRTIRALLQLSDDFTNRIDDVLGLRSDALLVRWTNSGTDRASGGAFERSLCELWIFGVDGLVTRWEQFDGDHDAEALARFDELATTAAPAHPTRRRVRATAATANLARLDAAIAARDRDGLAAVYAHEMQVVNRHLGWDVYDRQGALAAWGSLLSAETPRCRHEPLATLGDSLVVFRLSVSASGFAGRTFDVGAYERELFALVEVDSNGRQQRSEDFAADHLGDAVARLYERYAELLPEGPERTRAAARARSVAAHMGPHDLARYARAIGPAIEFADHRSMGFESVRGADGMLRVLGTIGEVAHDVANRVDDVLDLRSDAYLLRWTSYGTDRAGGGAFERCLLVLLVFGADGLVTRWELFGADRETEALARFDELTAGPPRSERRVRANAATANAARYAAAVAARDEGAFLSLYADDLDAVHHPTGFTYDRPGALTTSRALLRAPDLTFANESLATLGASLALCRVSWAASASPGRRFDVGPYENERILLIEVDAQGRRLREEGFAQDHLGNAVVRLYECYAELLPEGSERSRAAATARSIAASVLLAGAPEPERLRTALAPDLVHEDRRKVGLGTGRGAEAFLRGVDALLQLSEDFALRIEDVLDLRANAGLVRVTTAGTDRASGGAFERPFLLLLAFGSDGLVSRWEQLDVDRDTEALARFDELTAEPPATRRRVRPNAASAHAARLDAAIATRDADALSTLFADKSESVDHTTGTTFDQRGLLGTWRSLLSARDPRSRHQPLASLGDSLALFRLSTSASGFSGRTFDVGPYETDNVILIEADAQGQRRRSENFASDHLGNAVARLYERYAELLPEGSARARAAATARSVAALSGPISDTRWATALAPAVEVVDRRILATFSASGAEELLQGVRSWLEVGVDPAMFVDDVLRLESSALLSRRTHAGTDRVSGGAYEREFIQLLLFGADGLVTRFELFDLGHEAAALARFDELTAEPPAARFANASSRSMDRFERCWRERDWDGMVATLAPAHRVDDRRRLVGLQMSAAESLISLRFVFGMPESRIHIELLATRGERLALFRTRIAGQATDSGPVSEEHLQIVELDSDGRQGAIVLFDLDALDAAYAELDERFVAGEAALHASTWDATQRLSRVLSARDWERWPSVFSEDFVLQDHRLLGWGTRSSEEFLVQTRAMAELAPDFRVRGDHNLAINRRGMLSVGGWVGSREGGPFEIQMLSVMVLGQDGRLRCVHTYDLDQLDAARACFDALTAEPPAPAAHIENTATRAADRVDEVWAARDWKRLTELFPPGFRYIDRKRMTQMGELDRSQYLEWMRPLFGMSSSRLVQVVLATRGDRLALTRMRVDVADHDIGPSQIESLAIIEVDEHGVRVATVRFDAEDLAAAYAELDARFLAGEAAPHARVWAGMQEFKRAFAERDWDALAARCAGDLVVHDHRLLGWHSLHGPAAYLEALRSLVDLAPDTRLRIDHVTICEHGYLVITIWEGTREGGAYEDPSLMVAELDALGRIRRFDQYDLERLDQARARFAELRPDPLRIPPNAATRASDRFWECIERRDWEALRALCTPIAWEDRRRLIRTTGDCDTIIANTQLMSRAGTRVSRTRLATAGDRLALERLSLTGPPEGQEFETEVLEVTEVDAEGRVVALIHFDPEVRRAASAELLARDPHGDAIKRAMNDHDLDRLRAALPDDFVLNDHRRTGLGQLGKDDYITSLAALFEQAPDVIIEPLYTVAAEEHANLSVVPMYGTLAGVGAFESVMLRLASFRGGQIVGLELFEPEDLDAARARFEALRSG